MDSIDYLENSGKDFSFPKHKELLTEDFYDYNVNGSEGERNNPYGQQGGQPDYEDYSQPTHRSTATGVLSSYKKQLNLTARDMITRDYMDNVKDLKNNMAAHFSKADRLNYTKQMVERLRLGRGIESPVDGAGDEYGNYKKFEEGRNWVK